MRNRCSYAGLVSAYFSGYLAGTKNVSTNTIYSYRDTFVIFHGYLEKYCGFKLEKMLFNDLSRELILEFLQYLETERKYSISSRNQRLAALKSFAKYVQIECPDEMILCQRILSIDSKKAAKPTVQYLSNQQIDILMEQPDISTPKGRRDLAMILLLYDSAARVQELCDLRICDIRIDSLPVVHLLGKGRKSRDVPLTKPCAQVLRQYICENHLDIPERRNDQLFTNPQGKKLTRSGVSYVLAKYIHKANTAVGSFFPQITPHCLRHSKAMHLVEAGKNLIYIRDFLGHESIETTQVYAKANPEARRKAWAAGAVFCRGCYENLRQLCGSQKTGTRAQAVHPLCAGQGRGDLRVGIDAGCILDCARNGVHHYYPIGQLRHEQRDAAAGVDRCHQQRGLLGFHSAVGGHIDRRAADNRSVFYHDFDRLRQNVQPVDVRRDCADSVVYLCG